MKFNAGPGEASQARQQMVAQDWLFASRIVVSATNPSQGRKACLRPTEHPNAMPASERCPGSPRAGLYECVSPQPAQFAFGNGCDRLSYVGGRKP